VEFGEKRPDERLVARLQKGLQIVVVGFIERLITLHDTVPELSVAP